MDFKEKYLKYKNKYLNLKKQRGGACVHPYLEHGIGFNLLTFLNIVKEGGILTKKFIGSLHLHGTNLDDYISTSIPGGNTSNIYSVNGITFIIETSGLDCGRLSGAMDGEMHIHNSIPISKIEGVYIPYESAELPITSFNLCNLSHGSISIEDKLKRFGLPDEEIRRLATEWNTIDTYIDPKIIIQMPEVIERVKMKEGNIKLHYNLAYNELKNERKLPIERECSRYVIGQLNTAMSKDMSGYNLHTCIREILDKGGYNTIPIVPTLPGR